MPEGWKLYLGAFFLGLAVLSRLDDVFFLLAFFSYSVWQAPQRRVRAALPYLAPFLMIATYLLYNRIAVGTYLPVSGATKTSLALLPNLICSIYAILPISWDTQPFSQAPLFNFSNWAELMMRLFQMWFPILLCGGYLIVAAMRRSLHKRPVLTCLCAGTLLKGLYDLFFVIIWFQGHWYYPISIFTCNVLLAVLLDRMLHLRLPDLPRSSHPVLHRAGVLSLIALFIWFCFFGFISHKTAEQFGREAFRIYDRGPQIANDIRSAGATSYLELQDGIVSYATGMPGTSALGLAIDMEAVKARKEGRYLDLMDRRGIHDIVASGYYVTTMNRTLQSGNNPYDLLGNIQPSEYSRYSIQFGPRDVENDVAIYRIVKKTPANASLSNIPGH
jgi:hypothetical protein